jgi:hypothetical protein
MNEDEIVAQLVTELDGATADSVAVRTSGGDQKAEPDQVIIDWDSGRVMENGHNSFGGYITDPDGHNVGIEHHTYFEMEADCQLVFNDELKRDEAIDTIRDAFVPYEYDAKQFDKDTAEWEILMASPRTNNQFEPDWYVGGVVLRFMYVTRTDETGFDNIDTITQDVEINQSLEGVTTDTN